MNYHKISKFDIANGNGIRVVLWVSGCEHHCKGCHNKMTWDRNSGKPFDSEAMVELETELSSPFHDGITFSGGDPLAPYNRDMITNIAEHVKLMYPDKTVWMYTGYKYEDVKDLNVMKYVDVLVDGQYKTDLHDVSIRFCGSSNQRIIDVTSTRQQKHIVLWKPLEI